MDASVYLGSEKISKLIFKLGWPAALNFAVQSIYNITDVVFAGRWLGSLQIAAIVTVGAVIMLFSSAGIVVGAGGASIISRALGEKNRERISNTFGNQLLIVAISSISLCVIGFAFEKHILKAFGAYGDIFPYASLYYRVLLVGIPFFTFSMMGNMVIQSVGKAKVALTNSLIPTLLNGFLNPFFIKGLNMGIAGSAWATFVFDGFRVYSGFFLLLSRKTRREFWAGMAAI